MEEGKLPQPMAPDCVVEHGKMWGPKNIVLCKTHGRVMYTNGGMVIARSAEEFLADGS